MRVSVVVPALDPDQTLLAALRSAMQPGVADIVVSAPTGDPSERIVATVGPPIRFVPNPSGHTPDALNAAIAATDAEVIVRCDAHAELPDGYVERALAVLEATGADVVGGRQVPIGKGGLSDVVAWAMTSPFGAGDARYRIGGEAGPVDTVYLGVFRRDALDRLGGFDPRFLRSQDAELNHRIRAAGGVVWFDPELRVTYQPRGTLGSLARQYLGYGRYKRLFAKLHRGLRPRQIAPPLLVVGLAASAVLLPFHRAGWVLPGAYGAGLVVAALTSLPHLGAKAVLVPPVLAAMHLPWGLGFLLGPRR
jgi:hypothetical protein